VESVRHAANGHCFATVVSPRVLGTARTVGLVTLSMSSHCRHRESKPSGAHQHHDMVISSGIVA